MELRLPQKVGNFLTSYFIYDCELWDYEDEEERSKKTNNISIQLYATN
jgi:hypothetical protein